MLNNLKNTQQVYLVTGYTDLRRSIDGLAAIVQAQLKLDPYNSALFLFCGRRCDRIKGLGRAMDFCFFTSGWITESFSGLAMKRKLCSSRRSKPDG